MSTTVPVEWMTSLHKLASRTLALLMLPLQYPAKEEGNSMSRLYRSGLDAARIIVFPDSSCRLFFNSNFQIGLIMPLDGCKIGIAQILRSP